MAAPPSRGRAPTGGRSRRGGRPPRQPWQPRHDPAHLHALGAGAVLTTGRGVHLFDPRTIRASVGSLFALPVVPLASNQQLVDWVAAWRAEATVTVYATDEAGDVELRPGVALPRPAVLLLGTERTGLACALRDLADVTLRVPMVGSASSLNVAVTHGIVLHALMIAGQ